MELYVIGLGYTTANMIEHIHIFLEQVGGYMSCKRLHGINMGYDNVVNDNSSAKMGDKF